MANRIQIRRDTAANWASANPVLSQGELGLETDTGNLKVGDGVTAWASLAYEVILSSSVAVPPPTGVQATDTANIQNALNKASNGNPKRIVLQAGTYQINAALSMPFAPGTEIVGQGRFVTTIQQNTAGVPIFSFTHDLTHTITVQGMTVQFNGAQTNTGSVAFYYHVAGGTGGGFFHHIYRDLWIGYCYDGFKLEDGDGSQTLWNTTWQNVVWSGCARSAVRLAPASAIGIPELDFISCLVDCTPTVSGAQAFVFAACEVQMAGIGVEQWTDTAFYISGGGFLSIRNLHVESHNFNAATSVFASVQANTPFSLDGFSVSGKANSTNTAGCILFDPSGSGSCITVRNGSHYVTNNGSSAYITEVTWAGAGIAGTKIDVQNVIKGGGFLNQPLTGSRGSQVAEYSPMQAPRQYRSATAAYSQQQFDGVIVVNATSAVTVTLLDPTTCMVGVPVTVKNVTANTVTVASAGTSKTIDGAASTTLAQWAKGTFVSDGTQWLSV